MHPPAHDSELVERARRGDLDAYGELVRRHQDHALAAAYVMLGDRQEAEDATQEAFTRAFAALHRFRPGGPFRAWLLRIVVNEAHDLRSARGRRADILARASGQMESTAIAQSAEAAALNQRRREALLEALFKLPEVDRLVITCRYFLDLSEAETADVLGIARGTVKSRLSRALARLGPILRRLGPLVVVGPIWDRAVEQALQELARAGLVHPGAHLSQAVLESVAANPAAGAGLAGLWQQLRQHAAQTAAALAAVMIGGAVLLTQTRPPSPRQAAAGSSPAATGASVVVYGGDLTDADRQELTRYFGDVQVESTQTVAQQELVATLQGQGIAVAPTDGAISSIRLVCGRASGLQVQTHNITRVAAPTYAAALLTAGLIDVSVQVAAPTGKPVTGETALVGIFKAYPRCSDGNPPDPQRVRLAYEQLKIAASLASDGADMGRASAVVLEVLHRVVTGAAQDDRALEDAIDSAAGERNVPLGDRARSQLIPLFQQLRSLDYGSYSRGYVITQVGPDEVQLVHGSNT